MRHRRYSLAMLVVVAAALTAPGGADATPPGQNGPLAFELYSPVHDFAGQVARIQPDGSGRRVLTGPMPGEAPSPDWSPDGRWITFARCDGTASSCNIWVMRRDGGGKRQVTHCLPRWCFGNLGPTWTPDGRSIVFERDQRNRQGANRPGLFMIGADGTGLHRLTHAPIDRDTSHGDPRVSPDGRWIVFTQVVHESDDPNHLYIVSSRGGAPHRLTPAWLDSDSADWSPIGGLIVFAGHPRVPGVEFTANVYVIRSDGTGLRRITHSRAGEGFDFFPNWSPDGRRIVFNHADANVDDLFTMNPWGGDVRRVTHTANVFEINADWGPQLQ
ncbi:MAG: TolB protein [Gaiellales bacterium]|nr:TolB protein [Gaiellales bacterium]